MGNINETKVTGKVQELVANPSPLGLFGLAMVTLVASTSKLGITDGTAYVIPWALFLGAAAQFVAGVFDYKHDNTFGATAFCAYGFFWFAMAFSWMISNGMWGNGVAYDVHQMGYAFLGYFVFTMIMTVGAMGANKVLFIIFFLIDLLFLGLFMSTLGWGGAGFALLAAYAEVGISIMSFYGCAATVLNTHYGITVVPVGAAFGPWTKKAAAAKAGVAA
ncbi:MAG: acetate uptake transporter [Syntrophomonadaceae bacterium]|nr:acetate uptake transporter [Syntrophomonadaceae bacterium]